MRIDSSSVSSALLDPNLRAARAEAAKAAKGQQKPASTVSTDATESTRSAPTGPDGRPGFAYGIQKMIDAGRYVPAASNSRLGAALAQAGITAPSEAPDEVVPDAPEDVKTDLLYTTADVELLNSAWGATAGSDGFIEAYDFNADGVLDGADLAHLLANLGQPKPAGESALGDGEYTSADIEFLKQEWGAVEADSRASSRYDFNGDGQIDGDDLAALLSRLNPDSETPELDGPLLEEPPIAPSDPTLTEDAALAPPTLSFAEAIEGVDISALSDALASEPEDPSRVDLLAQLRAQLTDLINTGSADATQPTLLELLSRLAAE